MARSFSGTAQYLTKGSALATAVPISMACWYQPTATTGSSVMGIDITSGPPPNFDIEFSSTFTKITAEAWSAATDDETAVCATVLSTGTWYHICAVFASNTSRSVYVNGTGKVTSVVSVTPATTSNNAAIGAHSSGTIPTNGKVAFPAFWNVALSDADVASLALGCGPRRVQPQNLIAYAPLTGNRSPEPDLVKSPGWTLTGTPAEFVNIRIYAP